jgi:hypothetical protein
MGGRNDNQMGGVLYKIPESTSEAFRAFVLDKYGKNFKKGHFMEELSKAISRHISLEKVSSTRTQAHRTRSRLPEKLQRKIDKMTNYLLSEHGYDYGDGLVTLQPLKEAVKFAWGEDDRTYEKYVKILTGHQVLQQVTEGRFRFLPLVLNLDKLSEIDEKEDNAIKEKEFNRMVERYDV